MERLDARLGRRRRRDDGSEQTVAGEPAPAEAMLALQRTAGNRAVSGLLEPAASMRVGREPGGGTPGKTPRREGTTTWRGMWSHQGTLNSSRVPELGDPEQFRTRFPPFLVTGILAAVLRGEAPRLEEYADLDQVDVARMLITILTNDRSVLYWRDIGCTELTREGPVVLRPAPLEAVLGFMELRRAYDRQFLPVVPQEYAASGGGRVAVESAISDDPALGTETALRVAVSVIENKIQGQVFLARGFTDPEHQELAVKILALMVGNLETVVRMVRHGTEVKRPDGSTEWVRPAPAAAIAARLGIGPKAARAEGRSGHSETESTHAR